MSLSKVEEDIPPQDPTGHTIASVTRVCSTVADPRACPFHTICDLKSTQSCIGKCWINIQTNHSFLTPSTMKIADLPDQLTRLTPDDSGKGNVVMSLTRTLKVRP